MNTIHLQHIAMKKLIVLILLISSFSSKASYELIKIFNNNGEIEVGLNLTCPFMGLSQSANPNSILTRNSNEFDILLSLPYQDPAIACSPLPPEFVDPLREYFPLGILEPGEYSIVVKYVNNDEAIPPSMGIQINDFSQLDFQITRIAVIPIFNWIGLLLLILIFVAFARFLISRKHMI